MNFFSRTSNPEPSAERGSIILYAMLTMASMLAISLTLTALFVSKLQSAAAARDSIGALYAADSAAEKCLYESRQNKQQPPMTFSNSATYAITSDAAGNPLVTDNCNTLGSSSFGFRTTGTYRGVSRTLEISQ
jgi:hypothetical protein